MRMCNDDEYVCVVCDHENCVKITYGARQCFDAQGLIINDHLAALAAALDIDLSLDGS
jgi:hypothetical protein